jgi:UDP-glucose 4-epimerase
LVRRHALGLPAVVVSQFAWVRGKEAVMHRTVLVTGVAGMIGSHLLDALLERGYNVTGIDNMSFGKIENIRHNLRRSGFKFYHVDILDCNSLRILAKDAEVIVHLAAVKKVAEADSSMATLKTNAEGTENVFEVARMWRAKVIFASTSDVYGMSPNVPFKEDGDLLLGPSLVRRWSYAVAKLYGEQLAFAYYNDYRVPTVVLRYFGGFSERSSFAWSGGHIPIFIRAILNDEEVIIHGDGTQTRSMAYVEDLVEGTILAMESERAVGEVINLGNPEEMSVLDAAHLIHRLANTGRELKLRFVPMREVFGSYRDIMRRVPDLTKARELLGYEPRYSLEDAIRLTLAAGRAENRGSPARAEAGA